MNFRKISKWPLTPPPPFHPRFKKLCCAFLQRTFRTKVTPPPFPENSPFFPLKNTAKPEPNIWIGNRTLLGQDTLWVHTLNTAKPIFILYTFDQRCSYCCGGLCYRLCDLSNLIRQNIALNVPSCSR